MAAAAIAEERTKGREAAIWYETKKKLGQREEKREKGDRPGECAVGGI